MQPKQFFKVMMPGFRTRLYLPLSFCEHLSGERSKEAVVTSRKGALRVKFYKCSENGQFYFGDGWDEFVKQHDLHVGDFLLFEHMGSLSFQVIVYENSTNCEKEFPAADTSIKLPNPEKKRRKKKTVTHCPASPYFSVTMKPSNGDVRTPYVTIPVAFVKSHRLERLRKLLLRGPSRKIQEVKLRWNSGQRHLAICQGWDKFYKSHDLKLGDVCRFKIGSTATAKGFTRILDVEINPLPIQC